MKLAGPTLGPVSHSGGDLHDRDVFGVTRAEIVERCRLARARGAAMRCADKQP